MNKIVSSIGKGVERLSHSSASAEKIATEVAQVAPEAVKPAVLGEAVGKNLDTAKYIGGIPNGEKPVEGAIKPKVMSIVETIVKEDNEVGGVTEWDLDALNALKAKLETFQGPGYKRKPRA